MEVSYESVITARGTSVLRLLADHIGNTKVGVGSDRLRDLKKWYDLIDALANEKVALTTSTYAIVMDTLYKQRMDLILGVKDMKSSAEHHIVRLSHVGPMSPDDTSSMIISDDEYLMLAEKLYQRLWPLYPEDNGVTTFRPIIRTIDIEQLIKAGKVHKIDWDVVVPDRIDEDTDEGARLMACYGFNRQQGIIYYDNGYWYYNKPYQVVRIDGYVHTVNYTVGSEEPNDLWMYPLDEEPTAENIVAYDLNEPVQWGVVYEAKPKRNYRSGITRISTYTSVMITRNHRPFMRIPGRMDYALSKAHAIIMDLQEGPIDVNERDWDKKLHGRKVYFRGQPAVVDRFIWGQGNVILNADGEDFKRPGEYADDDIYWDEEEAKSVKVSILSQWIYWFREG